MSSVPLTQPATLDTWWAAELERSAQAEAVPPDTATRRKLTDVFADPRPVGVIDENNGLITHKSMADAVAADDPFFLRVPNWMIAVDLDDERSIPRSHHLFSRLLIDGHQPVLVHSGREGHRHVLCRGSREQLYRILQAVEVSKSELRWTIRPPMARHRHGGRATLLLPYAPESALARLRGRTHVRALGQGARWRVLNDTLRGETTVSEAVFGVALGAVNAGWTFEEFMTVVTCTSLGIGRLLARARGTKRLAPYPGVAGGDDLAGRMPSCQREPSSLPGHSRPRRPVPTALGHHFAMAWESRPG